MQTLKNFLKALVRVLFVLGFLMTFPLLIPMQDADLVVAQTEASLTTLLNQMHFFLPYGLIVLTVSLIGYFFLTVLPAHPRKKKIRLALLPIIILSLRAVYPIYATFFEKATEVGVILYEDTTTHEVGFVPDKLIEAYEKHNLEFDTSSSIVWFDNSQENLAVGDKVKLVTRGATSQNRDTGHEMLNVASVEKTE